MDGIWIGLGFGLGLGITVAFGFLCDYLSKKIERWESNRRYLKSTGAIK